MEDWGEVYVEGKAFLGYVEALAFEGYGAMFIIKDHGIGWLPLTALKALKKDSIRLRSVKCQLPEDANPPWPCLGRLSPPAAKGCPVLKIRLRVECEGGRAAKQHECTA